jgi:disulfide oxidoreductase YuzD
LPLLGTSNSHVKKDQLKIEARQKISPLLLVQDSANGRVLIADGYHRLCAVYSFDEDALIPCKII